MSTTPLWDAIQLHAQDQVATALRALCAGEQVRVRQGASEHLVTLTQDVDLCHKFAVSTIAEGQAIRKYGEVIGKASEHIDVGAHVHIHNLTSRRARS